MPLAILLTNSDGSPMTPMELFKHGGPIMWPILLVSFLLITVAVERRDIEGAVQFGQKCKDFVARILVYSLTNKEFSLTNAFIRASSLELARFGQGQATLDTCITAAPLLGLLGTVTGMMGTFAALNSGTGDIGASTGAITGGVAEALIATMCGLFIAITGLLPFNYLNARLEEARHEVEDASNSLEIIINKSANSPR